MNNTTQTNDNFVQIQDPFVLFTQWLEEATTSEINDPNAMALATVDTTGLPNVRMVLLKDFSSRGFIFYTNYESCKGQEILASMKASLGFHWKSLRRQVRIRGNVEKVSTEEADAYFQSRPRGSQIGAWASKQSQILENRFALEKAITEYTAQYAAKKIPRPPHWSGFCVNPLSIEFWRDRPFRLHDRLLFTRDSIKQNSWKKQKLYP
ncbi:MULTISPECIES: pyridoxamine 5'-phosphate oxidase [Bartonella]|uniref:Pyridoxine/pyridoxamine 5'-phosphate oxidase n=1 Tax=Bartonella rochalimae ATCC BAA-1498 TaxID=685782 RepID=E6YKX2_9HYPH|nr:MULTISPECIES: pyridoxamine 5'-phosphate oxidase [Bartonella]AQX18653.1 Pyridoxamine 5'-phosphate oxidase [Bartonella sp. A1379B]AQX23167.1 pyridoxamine 5'-phosphate oxidase [Bartonella sp. 11B]AQX23534.1 pyridoxamine 5'-phosphate oxidase [Bartonella sp. 114]AQX25622.1 Pyridoxamine 5'-phosphate oxidase [Bartonella sp. Coyote22sub2]KEC54218.1 pyridoxine/pyridoxamine 5'-phosphate oxidase [Bartonella rochalimae ATCC BAA-1498]